MLVMDVSDKASMSECNGVEHENELNFAQHLPGWMIEQKLPFYEEDCCPTCFQQHLDVIQS